MRRSYEALDGETQAWLRGLRRGRRRGTAGGLVARHRDRACWGWSPLPRSRGRGRRGRPSASSGPSTCSSAPSPTSCSTVTSPTRWAPHLLPLINAEGLDGREGVEQSGSNAWVVGGQRTASGSPLLAGDPHRTIELPGCYQQVGLACPEFDVVGFTFPGVPGVQHFAHAGSVAWGITNAMADYQDLTIESLRVAPGAAPGPARDRPLEARGVDGWEPVTRSRRDDRRARCDRRSRCRSSSRLAARSSPGSRRRSPRRSRRRQAALLSMRLGRMARRCVARGPTACARRARSTTTSASAPCCPCCGRAPSTTSSRRWPDGSSRSTAPSSPTRRGGCATSSSAASPTVTR